MKKQNKKPVTPDTSKENCPDLTFEQINSFDTVLKDYLDLCMEIYWQRVEDGTFPWPYEDGRDSTTID